MKKQLFCTQWKISNQPGKSMVEAMMTTKETGRQITLPYDAMIHEAVTPDTKNAGQTGYYPGGMYYYTKDFTAPEEWRNCLVQLEFEGSYGRTLVYLNGDFIGEQVYGYTNFFVDLNDSLKYGEENHLEVAVNNETEKNSRWYSGSGLYRDVRLYVGEAIHIPATGVRISTPEVTENEAVADVRISLGNRGFRKAKVHVETVILDDQGRAVASRVTPVTLFALGQDEAEQRIIIHKPKLWDVDNPHCYRCQIRLLEGERVWDEAEETFGIRTLSLNPSTGLSINGKTVKLRGACIHHDHGIMGAAALPDAEARKIGKLKEAGFNCIRMAHHPAGRTLLEVCDRFGMLVMDELSDAWTHTKNSNDFANDFNTCWEETVEAMVAKDYNHPSVILYGMGNEIQEAGTAKGARMGRRIHRKIKSLDDTRYTTNAVNGILAAGDRFPEIIGAAMAQLGMPVPDMTGPAQEVQGQEAQQEVQHQEAQRQEVQQEAQRQEVQGQEAQRQKVQRQEAQRQEVQRQEVQHQEKQRQETGGSDALNSMMGVMVGPLADAIAVSPILTELTEEFMETMDVAGYNYLTGRHAMEHERYPNRVILGTETFPGDIANLWRTVEENAHVIGDMTWTGYDYLGEAGIGIFHYDGGMNFQSMFPERAAYIGDLDLLGNRRPISYYRQIIYGLRKEPYIAVERLNRHGMNVGRTPWMWKDNMASWTWPGYEGKPAVIQVLSDAEEVELFLNGISKGRKPAGRANDWMAQFEIAYEPGTLEAVAVRNGIECERYRLCSADSGVRLSVEADRTSMSANGRDLCYLMIGTVDQNGTPNLWEEREISVRVEGPGSLAGFGSAQPSCERSYFDTSCKTYDGYVMAVIRAGLTEGTTRVTISSGGMEPVVAEIEER
ncbi:MAG: DUF4982 domain-containing protein [Lachnospiraceae bacterium]|nr:DUF4982 domain-containing protein [Lachnospiraceae bacterium]